MLSVHDLHTRQILESRDWYRLLRVLGSLWAWGVVAAVFLQLDRARVQRGAVMRGGWTRRGVVLMTAALLSGGAAEVLKALIGRLRPENSGGAYIFMSLAERLEGHWSDLGMPSSHAAVAFGAAITLSLMYRAGTPIFLLAAAGCGLTRVMTVQHFVSDVVAAAAVAYAVTLAVWRVDAWNNRGVPLDRELESRSR
jgi:membrane-associated phospholipid phosphatase